MSLRGSMDGAQQSNANTRWARRPQSEMASNTYTNSNSLPSPESEAINQWFASVSEYESTLEALSLASLDPAFKEELTAIEQWFRVLSEAERTAALYSLLQHSTRIQVRFFATVLQGMDSDVRDFSPALGSPNPQAQQNAQLVQPLNVTGQQGIVNRRNRTSAPASLHPLRTAARNSNWMGYNAPGVIAVGDEEGDEEVLDSVSPRPGSSSDSEMNPPIPSPNFPNLSNLSLDNQLSPMITGNWASLSNTPLAPMFPPTNNSTTAGSAQTPMQDYHRSSIVLDDVRKFRKSGRSSNGPFDGATAQPRRSSGLSLNPSHPAHPSSPNPGSGSVPLSPGPNTQQAAVNAQKSWRNGLSNAPGSPSVSGMFDQSQGQQQQLANLIAIQQQMQQMQNLAVAAMGGNLTSPGLGGLSQAQQQAQLQAQQVGGLLSPGFGNMNMRGVGMGLPSPMGMGMPSPGFQSGSRKQSGYRDHRVPHTPQTPTSAMTNPTTPNSATTFGSGANPADPISISLISDIPGWLRALRLHKYTSCFEGSTWEEMIEMNEEALEAKGVSALGARRKLVKVFDTVKQKIAAGGTDNVIGWESLGNAQKSDSAGLKEEEEEKEGEKETKE